MLAKNSGFTMVEFLFAIFILLIGLLGMLQAINLAMSQNIETMLRNEAITVADEAMMAQRNLAFDSIVSPAIPTVGSPRNIRGIFKIYSAQTIVDAQTAYSKRIQVVVSWSYKTKKNKHSVTSVVSTSPE